MQPQIKIRFYVFTLRNLAEIFGPAPDMSELEIGSQFVKKLKRWLAHFENMPSHEEAVENQMK